MASKSALLVAVLAAAGLVWWLSRPVKSGTKINAVAGLRG